MTALSTHRHLTSVVMCLFCRKLLRYKSIITSVDVQIMELNIYCCGAVTVFRRFSCDDVVFVDIFAALQCSEGSLVPFFIDSMLIIVWNECLGMSGLMEGALVLSH